MYTLIIITLIFTHAAAFFAGAKNAKRAESIKDGFKK